MKNRTIGDFVSSNLNGSVLVGDLRAVLKGVDENYIITFDGEGVATLAKLNGNAINFPKED